MSHPSFARRRRSPVLGTVAAAVGAVLAGVVAATASGGDAAAPAAATPEQGARLDRFDRLCTAADAVRDRLPRTGFDPAAVVDEVGTSPEALVAWVAGRTDWLASRGVLRGAAGVLMDRQGGHADRAVLLARLLQLAGHDVRLRRGDLSPAAATEVLGAWSAAVPTRRMLATSAPPQFEAILAEAETLVPLDRAELEVRILEGEAESASAQSAARQRSSILTEELRPLLGPWDAEHAAADRTRRLEAAADAWWIEFRPPARGAAAETDPWTGVSLLRPGPPEMLAPGAAPDGLEAGPSEPVALDAIPADQTHRIRWEILATRLEAGERRSGVALSVERAAAEVAGRPVRLSFSPVPLMGLPAATAEDPEAGRRTTEASLRAVDEWLPAIEIGRDRRIASSIRRDGTINPKPDLAGSGATQVGEAVRALGGLGADAEARDAQLLRVEVVITRHAPSQPPAVTRRVIVDLEAEAGSPGARSADLEDRRISALLTRIEFLVQPGWLDGAFVQDARLGWLAAARKPLAAWMLAAGTGDRGGMVTTLQTLPPPPSALLDLALVRRAWSPVGMAMAPTAANVLALHHRVDVEGDAATAVVEIDLIDVSVDPVPGGPGPESACAARMTQGVSDTLVEALVLADGRAGTDGIRNAALAFERDLLGGAGWAAVPEDERRGPLREVRAVDAASDAGDRWVVDPRTGTTVGRGSDGRGQALLEYTAKQLISMHGVLGALSGIMDCIDPNQSAEQLACCTRTYAIGNGAGLGFGAVLGAAGGYAIAEMLGGIVFGEAMNAGSGMVDCG